LSENFGVYIFSDRDFSLFGLQRWRHARAASGNEVCP
jgi:hypothetical protein